MGASSAGSWVFAPIMWVHTLSTRTGCAELKKPPGGEGGVPTWAHMSMTPKVFLSLAQRTLENAQHGSCSTQPLGWLEQALPPTQHRQ